MYLDPTDKYVLMHASRPHAGIWKKIGIVKTNKPGDAAHGNSLQGLSHLQPANYTPVSACEVLGPSQG
jgi:hypothetical protein